MSIMPTDEDIARENGFMQASAMYQARIADLEREIAAYQVRVDNDALRLADTSQELLNAHQILGTMSGRSAAHPVTADRFSRG